MTRAKMFESVTVAFTLALAGSVLVIAAGAVATVPSVAAAKVAMIAPGTSVAVLNQSCFGSTFCTRAFASLAATTTVTSAGRPWRCWSGSGPKRLRPPWLSSPLRHLPRPPPSRPRPSRRCTTGWDRNDPWRQSPPTIPSRGLCSWI